MKKSFLFNLFIVLMLCGVLYTLFFTSLGWLTRHGEEVKVPNVTNVDMKAAVSMLERAGFDIQIDSAYEPDKKPFLVLGQQPGIGAVVKQGRTIFLTVNKSEPLQTTMPNLIGLSFRSAFMILKSSRLVMGDTTYKPDIAKGAILEQLINGQPVRPGQIISQGSVVSLVIGDGLGETEMNVPDLIGTGYDEAMATVSASGLKVDVVWDGEITDSSTAVIYNQQPKAINELTNNNRIREGDVIGIWIKQNPTNEELENNRNSTQTVIRDSTDIKTP
ncbi:PASTA domain-containing protein [Chitinophagaceae bacterium MMS25-I14]